MQKINYNGETYYYQNNIFYDSTFIEVDRTTKMLIAKNFYTSINYEKLNQQELLTYITNIKDLELNKLTYKVCVFGMYKFNNNEFYKVMLPMLTSTLRSLNMPDEAIRIALDYSSKYYLCSKALFTSLAAAYCDIKDYVNAKKYIDRAYAMQGGSVHEVNEISLVYKRINAETR